MIACPPVIRPCVLIRVYDRLADLEVALELVRSRWTRFPYHVVVAASGAADGHRPSPRARALADEVVELDANPGKMAGTGRLLRAGLARVPADCDWTVLLEADTWVLGDAVIERTIARLTRARAGWCSAEWVERRWTLGLDLVVARRDLLASDPALFDGGDALEARVCHRLAERGERFLYLREAMPVHAPRLLRCLAGAPGGRFRCFPAVPMVTHHVEDLPGGIEEKKVLANACAGERVFPVGDAATLVRLRRRMLFERRLARLAPRSGWLGKRPWHPRPPANDRAAPGPG